MSSCCWGIGVKPPAPPASTAVTSPPRFARCRAAVKPPPPLPPRPTSTHTERGPNVSMVSVARFAPAFSIIRATSIPTSSIISRSTSRICSPVTAGTASSSIAGNVVTPRSCPSSEAHRSVSQGPLSISLVHVSDRENDRDGLDLLPLGRLASRHPALGHVAFALALGPLALWHVRLRDVGFGRFPARHLGFQPLSIGHVPVARLTISHAVFPSLPPSRARRDADPSRSPRTARRSRAARWQR